MTEPFDPHRDGKRGLVIGFIAGAMVSGLLLWLFTLPG